MRLDTLSFFRDEAALLARLWERVRDPADPRLEDAFREALMRVEQVDYLFASVRSNVEAHFDILRGQSEDAGQLALECFVPGTVFDQRRLHDSEQARFHARLSAEAFYYFAWRLCAVLQSLPYLKKFYSPGIRKVRNEVIEHPEDATEMLYGIELQRGPTSLRLKVPPNGAMPLDAGILENAIELRDRLNRALGRALERAGDRAREPGTA